MKKKYKVLLLIVFVLIVLFLVAYIVLNFGNFNNNEDYEVIDKIDNYNYNVLSRDSKLFNSEFKKLKNILNKENINYSEYAKILSNLFIIDFFTLNNKDNKYDIGGVNYIFSNALDNFKLNATDTIYKYVGNKKIEFPEVKKIINNEVTEENYTYDKNTYNGYKVNIEWDYVKDLGYENKGEIILINVNNKLEIVSFKGVREN